jgi:hypothetical protein
VFHSAEEAREQVNEAYLEYRQGMNDPAREVAFLEKQAFIKKAITKVLIEKYSKR